MLLCMLESDDLSTAVHGARGLAALGDMRALPKLSEAMRADECPRRLGAAMALAELDHPSVPMLLLDGLERESKSTTQVFILRAMVEHGHLSNPRAASRLRKLAKSNRFPDTVAAEVPWALSKAGALRDQDVIDSVEAAGASGRGSDYVLGVAMGAAGAGGAQTMKALAQLTASKTPHVADAALQALQGAAGEKDDDALNALVSLAKSRKGKERERIVNAVWIGVWNRTQPPQEKAKTLLTLGIPELVMTGAHELAELGDLSALDTLQAECSREGIAAQYGMVKTLAPPKQLKVRQSLVSLFGKTDSRLVRKTILWTLGPHAAEADVAPFLAKIAEDHSDLVKHMEQAPSATQERVRRGAARSTGQGFSELDCYQPVWNPSSQFLVMMLQSYADKERWHKDLRGAAESDAGRDRFLVALHTMTEFDDKTVSTMASEALAYIESLKTEKASGAASAKVEPPADRSPLPTVLAIGAVAALACVLAYLWRRRRSER